MGSAPHLEAFLDAARYFIGIKESPNGSNNFTDSRGKEMLRLYGTGGGAAWCAIFVSACAVKAGISGKVIAKNSYANGVAIDTVNKCGGTWIDGPYINGGKAVTPIPGDIINFGNASYHGHDHATHVGIVEYVEDGKIHTIEGNVSNQCMRKTYSLDYGSINTFVRPDWSRVGDDITAYLASAGQAVFGPLYQNKNDRHDMTMREVGYLNNKYELSNSASDIKISIINYTSVLGDIYDMFAPAVLGQGEPQIDTSQLSGNIKIAMDYFLEMGFSASSASALVGCLQTYSNVDPSYKVVSGKYLYHGICAWTSTQMLSVKRRIGEDYLTNLTGQLEYLLYDYSVHNSVTLVAFKNQALDKANVEAVVEVFMKSYNAHYTLDYYITTAKKHAVEIFNKLIITQAPIVGSISNLRDEKGNALSSKYSVPIPSSVSQTGIIDDYTSYSAWYTRWHKSSPQRKLAEMWKNQGYPCNKGIATIGGYYCVAVRPKFGKCGEVIVITLDGGIQFPAIICDEKGDDAGSEWGHVKSGGKISLIEWERIKTKNGKVITGTSFTDVDSRGFNEWYGKKVINITNYGKYADVRWS